MIYSSYLHEYLVDSKALATSIKKMLPLDLLAIPKLNEKNVLRAAVLFPYFPCQ